MSRGIHTQLVLQQFFVGEWAPNVKQKFKRKKAAGCLVELISKVASGFYPSGFYPKNPDFVWGVKNLHRAKRAVF